MVQPVNGVTLICAWEPCQQPFTVFPSQVKKAKYCSRPCQWLATAAGRSKKVTLTCANPQCNKSFQVFAYKLNEGVEHRCCSRACKAGFAASRVYTSEFAAEFWSHVAKGDPDACWPWQDRTGRGGYGMTYVPGRPNDTGTHIVAFFLTHERWPAPGMNVCHSCDNPPCCNGKHLWEGTTLENAQDSMLKGRKPRGERHGMSKLSDAQWQEIISLLETSSLPRRTIAAQYGISYHTLANREKRHYKTPLKKRRKNIKQR